MRRLSIELPESVAADPFNAGLALSPDGTRLVFVGVSDNRQLYMRSLDQLDA